MNTERANARTTHDDWELRVQDWLDGAADAQESAAVEAHLAKCETCPQLVAALRELDEELGALHEPQLSATFDQQLMAQVAADELARKRTRERALQDEAAFVVTAPSSFLRRGVMAIVGTMVIAALCLAWAFVTLSPAGIIVKLASIPAWQWLTLGVGTTAAAVAYVRWVQS